jgi:hypothetical protein
MERHQQARHQQQQGNLKRQTSRAIALVMGIGSLFLTGGLGSSGAIATEIGRNAAPTLADGTYLYGETGQANELGKGYLVFQVNDRHVVGAFYYPQSEFSCFTGELNQQTLEVLSLPTTAEPMSSFAVPLANLHPIQTVGNSEQATLASCHQEVVAFLRNDKTAMQIEP